MLAPAGRCYGCLWGKGQPWVRKRVGGLKAHKSWPLVAQVSSLFTQQHTYLCVPCRHSRLPGLIMERKGRGFQELGQPQGRGCWKGGLCTMKVLGFWPHVLNFSVFGFGSVSRHLGGVDRDRWTGEQPGGGE